MGTGVLPVRGALAIVERALLDTIGLALRKRGPVAADTTALAAMSSMGSSSGSLNDGDLRFVTADGACYVWRSASTATVGAGVVRPTDRVTSGKPGRWLLTSSTRLDPNGLQLSAVQAGYLRAVQLYQGETTQEDWDNRIFARRPAVLIQWTGETGEQKSNLRGALKVVYFHFEIWAISFNARAGTEAALGSPVAAEATADPGANAIKDDLTDLLDGLTGSEMATDGIDHLRLYDWAPRIERGTQALPQRLFVYSAPLDVRCTVGKEDRPTRYTFDEMTATGVDPADGTTPLTPPNYEAIP